MDVIETAIRNAFEKGDPTDRAFREKVYRSAFAALERALKANPGVTVEMAINRRKRLQAKIAEIESEFIPAVPAVEPDIARAEQALAEVAIEPPARAPGQAEAARPVAPRPVVRSAAAEPSAAPPVEIGGGSFPVPPAAPTREAPVMPPPSREPAGAPDQRIEPVLDAPHARAAEGARSAATLPGSEVAADPGRGAEGGCRRSFAAAFTIVILLSLVGAGVWWGLSTGLFKSPAERDTSVPNPPPTAQEEAFDPDEEPIGAPALPGAADAARNWISIFTPADAALVSAPQGTQADIMEDDGGRFIRVRSTADNAVVFDVGQGVLEQLSGKRAVFDIVARAEEGKETQISVSCSFGELGGCGRKRYAVGYEKGDLLFEVEFPAERPGAGGTIAVISDIGAEGKAVDIFEIKASPTP